MPTERELTATEREELELAAQQALAMLESAPTELEAMVVALEARVLQLRPDGVPPDADLFELGALLAACFEMGLGWELIEVTWEAGTVALAVAEMDRSVCVLPFHAVGQLFYEPTLPTALLRTFQRLAAGERPPGGVRGAFAVLLPT